MSNQSQWPERWIELFYGHLNGSLGEEDAAEFEALMRDPRFESLRERLEESDYPALRMAEYDRYDARAAFRRFRREAGICRPDRTVRRRAIALTGVAAAVALTVGAFFALRSAAPTDRERTMRLAEAIYPAPDKVTLTLADGRTLSLDDRMETQIEGVGRLSYGTEGVRIEATGPAAEADPSTEGAACNELSVPEGGKCLVTLDDGTRVWLNARSTLRYPVRFARGERRVELRGEALFDVTHNPERPFVVEAGKATLRVRGTKFNVRDFDEEAVASTTLLEGCVEVGNLSGTVTLRPGMQARTQGAAEPLSVREVDAQTYAAWTEDKIAFYSADLEEVLSDIRRLYRVETVVSVDPNLYTLTGKIPRDYSLAQVIDLIEAITDLELTMPDEKTLLVNKRQ